MPGIFLCLALLDLILYCGTSNHTNHTQPTAPTKMKTYKIIRSFNPNLNKSNRTIERGLTLEEAQAHCKRSDTREAGVWFDCYTAE